MKLALVALALLAACGTSSPEQCPAAASDPRELNGTDCATDGLACEYALPDGRGYFCACSLGHLWCSDCNSTAYGFGSCTAGQTCSYSSWETDCDCTCTVRDNWNCTSLDAVSPCPRDPDPFAPTR